MRPFEQLRFEDVPELPRRPHRFAETKVRDLELASRPFGKVRVRVRVFGAGPPLLLVHGFMTSSYSFRYVLASLGARFTLYMPDLIGSGESDKPQASYAPERLAESIGEIMDALGIAGAPVIGNSMGGYLCMQLALARPTVMKRLSVLHAPGVATAKMRLLRVLLEVLPHRALIDGLVRRDPERWVHRNVHYFDETLKSKEEHRVYAAALSTPAGRAAFIATLRDALDARAMDDFVARLRRQTFPIPLQLVYSDRDPMVPPVVGDRLAALIPSAQLVRMPDTSHFAHVDTPERFVEIALPFIAAQLMLD